LTIFTLEVTHKF